MQWRESKSKRNRERETDEELKEFQVDDKKVIDCDQNLATLTVSIRHG